MKLFGKISMICVLFTIMTTIGCVKEGPAGATGPAGANGAPGTPGAPGATGATGPAGSANVIYSDWFAFAASNWKDTLLFVDYNVSRAIKLAPSLTATHVSNGVIMCYMAYKPATAQQFFTQLPFIYDYNQSNVQVNYIPQTGKFTYYWVYDGNNVAANGINSSLNLLADYSFRYVIIPGGVKASGFVGETGFTLDQLKAMPSYQLEKVLKIPTTGSNF